MLFLTMAEPFVALPNSTGPEQRSGPHHMLSVRAIRPSRVY